MLTTIILAVISGLAYANVGLKVGIDNYKVQIPENATDDNKAFTFLASVFVGSIWPLLLFTLLNNRKTKKAKELAKSANKALLPANSDSPVDVAAKLVTLQEKRAKLEQEMLEMGREIEELKADPEVSKVLRFPPRY